MDISFGVFFLLIYFTIIALPANGLHEIIRDPYTISLTVQCIMYNACLSNKLKKLCSSGRFSCRLLACARDYFASINCTVNSVNRTICTVLSSRFQLRKSALYYLLCVLNLLYFLLLLINCFHSHGKKKIIIFEFY